MKVIILYRPISEHARIVEEFVHDFQQNRPDRHVDLISLETKEGAALATLYDVVRYPAILALAGDGRLLQAWQGESLPLMNEVAAYGSS